jgi:hypothetical protein
VFYFVSAGAIVQYNFCVWTDCRHRCSNEQNRSDLSASDGTSVQSLQYDAGVFTCHGKARAFIGEHNFNLLTTFDVVSKMRWSRQLTYMHYIFDKFGVATLFFTETSLRCGVQPAADIDEDVRRRHVATTSAQTHEIP